MQFIPPPKCIITGTIKLELWQLSPHWTKKNSEFSRLCQQKMYSFRKLWINWVQWLVVYYKTNVFDHTRSNVNKHRLTPEINVAFKIFLNVLSLTQGKFWTYVPVQGNAALEPCKKEKRFKHENLPSKREVMILICVIDDWEIRHKYSLNKKYEKHKDAM